MAADTTVDAGKIGFDAGMHRADQHVGQRRKRVASLLRRQRAGKNAGADQEHMLLAEQADCVEHVFVGAGLADSPRQLRFQALGVGQRAKKSRIDQRIDDVGMLGENIRKPWRSAENKRDKANEFGILSQ